MTESVTDSPGETPLRTRNLYVFRPGEASRGLPRWQFGLEPSGRCEATITYPIAGLPWRHTRQRTMHATLDAFTTETIFAEIAALPGAAPNACLANTVLWSDQTEKCNGITRDSATDTLCLSLGIQNEDFMFQTYFSMRENCPVLLDSVVFKVVTGLLAPYVGLFPIR